MAWFTEDSLEDEAKAARRLFQVIDQHQPDVATIIFKARHHGIIADYHRVPGNSLGGSFNPRTGVLEITEATFCGINRMPPLPDARPVPIHEIGHAWLRHGRPRNFTRVHEASNKVVRSDEWQVEYFTLAFLIPYDLVNYHPGLSARQLSEVFGVPVAFARKRLSALKRVFERGPEFNRTLPKTAIDFLASNKVFLREPCRACGKPAVIRVGTKKICDSCGEEN